MKTRKIKSKKVILIVLMLFIFFVLSVFGVFIYLYNSYKLDISNLTSINNGVKVVSSTGTDTSLYNSNRSIVKLDDLPDYVVNAFIDVEDKRFYKHNGYDLKRIIKAGIVNIFNKQKSQGASTISQQLIKNALLTNEKTYARKIKEIILAIKMEKQFTKKEIMEMYLNTIYFGSNAYGIENASKTYFNKSAKELNVNEACCLAGIIKSPAYYSPITNIENAIKRKNLVGKLLYENNNITQEEYNKVISTGINIIKSNTHEQSYEQEAILEACKLLNISERQLINKKYQIKTFKDDNLNNELIKINNNITQIENKTIDSVSIVVNKHGHVIAYYANSNYNLHNVCRQPASILKPLAVYLPCITHNILSPATQVLDEEIKYNGYSPKNVDKKYHGYISCKDALASSLNVPAVKLLDCVGLSKSKEILTNLGINIPNCDKNLSLALGATKYGIKLMDLVSAYSTIANLGKYHQLSFVSEILDNNNNVIYKHENFAEQVATAEDCFLLTDMLKETTKTGTAKRLESLNLQIASKTGTASTSNGNTDIYNVAYTSEHTIFNWIADIDNVYLPENMLSSVEPTEISKQICSYLYLNDKPEDFAKPNNVIYAPYSLIELEKNHVLIRPKQDELERFIEYDYFKIDNLPKENLKQNDMVQLSVSLDYLGAIIQFDALKNKEYKLYKMANNTIMLLLEVKNTNKVITFNDKNIFKDDEIEYFLEDYSNSIISEKIKIRPKDFLINYLNNEFLSTKKKWYV